MFLVVQVVQVSRPGSLDLHHQKLPNVTEEHPVSPENRAPRAPESPREMWERRFTEQGRAAAPGASNPYKPGSAAATWWQRGNQK